MPQILVAFGFAANKLICTGAEVVVGKNWRGRIWYNSSGTIIFEEGIEEINNIKLDLTNYNNFNNNYVIELYFPKSLKKFNGSISLSGGPVKMNIPDGANINFKPGSIYNCNNRSGLDPSFIEYLQKQNYPFDKE